MDSESLEEEEEEEEEEHEFEREWVSGHFAEDDIEDIETAADKSATRGKKRTRIEYERERETEDKIAATL